MESAEAQVEPLPAEPGPEVSPVAKAKKPRRPQERAGGAAAGAGGAATSGAAAGERPNVAAHPRASRAVARAKGSGGLAGFLIAGYLSLPTHTLADAGLRALIAGVLCYVAAWAGALFVWRRLVVLEVKAREQQLVGGMGPEAAGEPRRPRPPGGRR